MADERHTNQQEFNEVSRAFGKVEQKLDDTHTLLKAYILVVDSKLKDHEERIAINDSWRKEMNQKIAWISAAFTVVLSGSFYAAKTLWAYFTSGQNG